MMDEVHLWFKALHVIAVVAWMAALFYLPRLFVYHAVAAVGSEVSEQFKIMESRLALAIMWPAGIAAWVFGILTIFAAGFWPSLPVWLWLKLGIVAGLSAVHFVLHRHVGEFARDLRLKDQRYYRILNEVPTFVLIAAVILVIIKPFS